MRIAYVAVDCSDDILSWSGTPYHLLSNLRKHDVEVSVISPLSREAARFLVFQQALARLRGRRFDVDRYPIVLDSFAHQIQRRIQSDRIDLVLSTSTIPITRLHCSQPIVTYTDAVIHGSTGYYAEFSNLTDAANKRGRRQEETALANVSLAVYGSDWAADDARKLTDPAKVKVIPFGANLEITHTEADIRELIALRARRVEKGCTLLFSGVEWERKGGQIAFNAARILNESGIPTKLILIGCNPPSPVPSYVERLGFISKETEQGKAKLRNLYERADILIAPSRAEAAGIVFCEAAAFGLPVLATDTGGIGTYVQNGKNGLRLPLKDNGPQFAAAARTILQSPEIYSAYGHAAYDAFATRLNWGTAVSSLVQLFNGLLQRPEPRVASNAALSTRA